MANEKRLIYANALEEQLMEEMKMYNSPIEMLITDIQHQIVQQQDEQIYQAVVNCIPNVDKDELIRALQYDREQYEKGYQDAIRDKDLVEVVRCKDCKHLMFSDCYGECGQGYMGIVKPYDFCSYGERKDNG